MISNNIIKGTALWDNTSPDDIKNSLLCNTEIDRDYIESSIGFAADMVADYHISDRKGFIVVRLKSGLAFNFKCSFKAFEEVLKSCGYLINQIG